VSTPQRRTVRIFGTQSAGALDSGRPSSDARASTEYTARVENCSVLSGCRAWIPSHQRSGFTSAFVEPRCARGWLSRRFRLRPPLGWRRS
jgi:hypothetical protein